MRWPLSNFGQSTLANPCSDHASILLSIKSLPKINGPFRIERSWLSHDSIREIVANAWHFTPPTNDATTTQELKLGKTRATLKSWSAKIKVAERAKNTNLLSKIIMLDHKEETCPLLIQSYRIESLLEIKELLLIYKNKEIYWKQCAKVKWLRKVIITLLIFI